MASAPLPATSPKKTKKVIQVETAPAPVAARKPAGVSLAKFREAVAESDRAKKAAALLRQHSKQVTTVAMAAGTAVATGVGALFLSKYYDREQLEIYGVDIRYGVAALTVVAGGYGLQKRKWWGLYAILAGLGIGLATGAQRMVTGASGASGFGRPGGGVHIDRSGGFDRV